MPVGSQYIIFIEGTNSFKTGRGVVHSSGKLSQWSDLKEIVTKQDVLSHGDN